MSFKFQALTRLFRSSRLWAAERAVESIEYLGLTAALVALLGGVGVAFDRGGAQRLGAEVVHTMVCWVSYLSGEAECPPSQEVAAAPPQPLPTLVPTPCPYLACEPPPKSEPPEPEGHRPPKEPLLSWLLEKLGLAGEAGQEWVERFGEYLKTLPEEERGAVLAGLLPFLLFLTLLGVGLTLGGPAASLGAAGLLASALAGWLYGSGHPGGFNNLAATLSGLSAWLLVVFGLDALGRLALRVRERRRAAHLAKLLPQEPPPGEDLWDKALLILGGIALAEPTPFGEVGWLGLVGFRALVLFAAGGLAFSLSRPVDYSRFPTSSYSTTVAQQVPSRDSLAAEVRVVLQEGYGREGKAAEVPAAGEPAMPAGPELDPDRFDRNQITVEIDQENRMRHILEGSPRVRPGGHGWERLVPNINNIESIPARFQAIRPYIQEAVMRADWDVVRAVPGRWRLLEFRQVIQGEEVVVQVWQDLQRGLLTPSDAWVAVP